MGRVRLEISLGIALRVKSEELRGRAAKSIETGRMIQDLSISSFQA